MKDLNWYYIIAGFAITVIAQVGAWFSITYNLNTQS